MNSKLTPPDWDAYEPEMLINVADMQYYYENFTEIVDVRSDKNELAIGTLDGRVTALEQSTPIGPGGKGAYLNLGGTPERYPTAEEMVAGDTPEQTSFLVVARTDGIYFYNPKSKLLIPPKKGGGTVAVHASFPDIFDAGHTIKHDTRIGKSGVYTAKVSDLNLDGSFLSYDTCKVLVVTTADMEYQTAMHPDGTASRIFNKGENVAPWSMHSGGGTGGGGGGVDPIVIQEINRRLGVLESVDHIRTFVGLEDVEVDSVLDRSGLLYMDEFGKIKGGASNPMLLHGAIPISIKGIGAKPTVTSTTASGGTFASSPYVILTSPTPRTNTLCRFIRHDEPIFTSTQGREGRTTYIVNHSNVNQTLRLAPTQQFLMPEGMVGGTRVLKPMSVHCYLPTYVDNGSGVEIECWVFMGMAPLVEADVAALMQEIQDLKDKDIAIEGRIDTIAAEQALGKTVVEGLQQTDIELVDRIVDLENAPAPVMNFAGLTDTPSGYHPGKLLGYNLAGTALMPYDRIRTVKDLEDTPSTYVGQATRVLTVKVDESGFEFTEFPRVKDIQDKVVALEGEMVIANTEIFDIKAENVDQGRDIASVNTQSIQNKKDLEVHKDRLDVLEAQETRGRNFLHDTGVSTNNISADTTSQYDVVIQEATSGVVRVILPTIVSSATIALPGQVNVGRRQLVINDGGVPMDVRGAPAQQMIFPGRITQLSFSLPPKQTIELYSENYGGMFYWRVARVGFTNSKDLEDKITQVSTSVSSVATVAEANRVSLAEVREPINHNRVYWGPNKLITSMLGRSAATVTSTECTSSNYLIGSRTSGVQVVELPEIISRGNVAAAHQVKAGRDMVFVNTKNGTMRATAYGANYILLPDGTRPQTYDLLPGRCLQLMSGNPGWGLGWVIISDAPVIAP